MPELTKEGRAKLDQINKFGAEAGLPPMSQTAFMLMEMLLGDKAINGLIIELESRVGATEKPEPTVEEELMSDEDEDVADMLGKNYEDKISGVVGICTSVSQDIDGMICGLLQPRCTKDNKLPERTWFEISRLMEVA